MEVKKCAKCKIEKPFTEFNSDKTNKDGLESRCRRCKSEDNKKRLQKKKQTIEYAFVTEKVCNKCDQCLPASQFQKDSYSKDCLKKMCKKCYSVKRKTPTQIEKNVTVLHKVCNKCNIDKDITNFKKNYTSSDNYFHICIDCMPKNTWTKEKQRKSHKKYSEKENVKIIRSLRCSQNRRINDAFKKIGSTKTNKTIEYLGCTIEFLKEWFEYLMKGTGMSWDNYSEWQIDHVKPCKSFNLTDEKDIKECFSWKNLQPLTRLENIKKCANIIPELIENHKLRVKEFERSLTAKNKEGELRELP